MFVIPRQYTALSNNRMEEEIERLSREVDGADLLTAKEQISYFCRRNNASAVLTKKSRRCCSIAFTVAISCLNFSLLPSSFARASANR